MTRILAALLITTALAAPAFADTMAKDMACSAFTKMDSAGMMATMTDAMKSGDAMAAPDATKTDTTKTDTTKTGDAMAMSPEDSMKALVKTCTEHPDMMVMDAMHSKM
jgi:hypothetical protein